MQNTKWKVILVGDSGVGKTSIINSFVEGQPSKEHRATIALDRKAMTVNVEGIPVNMHLWDTAGQERFRSLMPIYFRESALILLVFDVTSAVSFSQLPLWMENVSLYAPSQSVLLLVGNKKDLVRQRKITPEDGKKAAEKFKCHYLEVSAMDVSSVNELMQVSARQIYDEFMLNDNGILRPEFVQPYFHSDTPGGHDSSVPVMGPPTSGCFSLPSRCNCS